MAVDIGPGEVRLHIGAHKTATTHLQDNLAAQHHALLKGGCVFLPRPFVRKTNLVGAVFNNHLAPAQPWERKTSLEGFLKLPPGFPRRLLVSEEDILGMMKDMLVGFYPHARLRLLPFAAVTRPEKTELFLSIRDYADLLPSAYSQVLRGTSAVEPFAVHQDRWLASPPSWAALAETILGAFNGARLTVWTLDAYLRSPASIMQLVSGVAVPEALPNVPEGTVRLTTTAVRRIEMLDPALDATARRDAVLAIVADERAGARYDPLTPEQKAFFSARYQSDLARLRSLPLTLLS